MSYVLFGLSFIWFIIAIWLYKFKTNLSRLQIGNIWKTNDGDIVQICQMGDPKEDYMLKCTINNEGCEYNTLGEKRSSKQNPKQNSKQNDDKKLAKHIGNRETNPEYFL